jgi:hypothetical protein
VVTLLICPPSYAARDARIRERRAKELVEARYASLIANASDVILIVAPDGVFHRLAGVRALRSA